MQQVDGRLLFSPSDLNNFLECEHLTRLELLVARRELERPKVENPHRDLITRKGEEHERRCLERLRAEGGRIEEIAFEGDFAEAARATEEAMRSGADVIYQACLVDPEGWRGFADFLVRGNDGAYEVVDAKLARSPKPYYVLQLCFYSQQVGRLQGRDPERMHVVLGSGELASYRPADFAAYYRRVRTRFLTATAEERETYPYPVEFCSLCDFRELCDARWDADDHLVRVANIRREQIVRLGTVAITTLEDLAVAEPGTDVPRMAAPTFEKLRSQAELQYAHRLSGEHRYVLLEPEEERGFGLLPEPSPGDLFFDMEGDPFWAPERSLEYLFGFLWSEDGEIPFEPIWAHDRDEERRAFERAVDLIHGRLADDPTLHVYHYASYEPTALKRLAAEYGTREDELDDLLRREVFVDLFAVVRQALRASVPSYSIKQLEPFYALERTAALASGDDALLTYEDWKDSRDPALLEAIRCYNREDCLSTLALRDWLLGLREEAEQTFGCAIPWREPPEVREPTPERLDELEERERLKAELAAAGNELAAHLLDYHRREAKPVWWAFFARLEMTAAELVEDSEAIGELEQVSSEELPPPRRSVAFTFSFPPQEHKLGPGDEVVDPVTARSPGALESVDDAEGLLVLTRGVGRTDPIPRALIPGGAWDDTCQREALLRFARSLAAGGGRYPALEAVLRREPFDRPVQTTDLEEMKRLVLGLDRGYLFVQGPPGSGKTWTGARLIVHLIGEGKRVGVAAQSHKAIHNLLREVEKVAAEEGVRFRGFKKSSSGNDESVYEGPFIESVDAVAAFGDAGLRLRAGTAWLFAREELDEWEVVDHLFVDEAGQVSLADALAMGTCARNLVLLGDPLQLAQVTQGTHPGDSGQSVLEHLLGDAQTIPEDRGLFLEHSFRMHPDVCRFVSEAFYEGRLESAPECARQTTELGTGLRFVPVDHVGNRQASSEEAEAIAREIGRMAGASYTDARGTTRPLRLDDFMVVSPYNAQVRLLRETLPDGVRVGTVDKFQGQEAPVVFFSMATSSGEDIPRNVEFLFSRNRLNVAVSRARCLAVIVACPRLLEINCRSIEQMRLANALCLAVELADA